ncbi:hypothetical protein ACQ4PT_007619 [Festuca glaucescens]
MVHLVMHLATEAKIGGPVCYRSMWFTERYLGRLKSNVRNKAHPKGSIAEAYLADECMTFCSRYIVGFETKHNLPSRNEDSEELVGRSDVPRRSTLFPHAGNPVGNPGNYVLRGLEKVQAHRYVLFNCSDVNSYLRAHADEMTHRRNLNVDTIERTQNEKFHEWFRAHIKKLEKENGINGIKNDIRWLSQGPVHAARRYRAFNSRGFRNANPVLRDVTYYGRVIDIVELNYSGQFSVVLFKCEWIDVFSEEGIQKDKYGYTLVNFSHLMHKGDKIEHEPFIFPDQADQVFYVEDEHNPGWSVVMKQPRPRDVYDIGIERAVDTETEPFHVSHLGEMFKRKNNNQYWVRTDVEGTLVDANIASSKEEGQNHEGCGEEVET